MERQATVVELKNLNEFNKVMANAGESVVVVLYHNECPTAESEFDKMENEYSNCIFCKVNTLNSTDIREKYACLGANPYFKFYKNGTLIDEIKFKIYWRDQECAVRKALAKHNGDDLPQQPTAASRKCGQIAITLD